MQHIKLNVSGYANAAQNTVSIMHGAWAMKLASQGRPEPTVICV